MVPQTTVSLGLCLSPLARPLGMTPPAGPGLPESPVQKGGTGRTMLWLLLCCMCSLQGWAHRCANSRHSSYLLPCSVGRGVILGHSQLLCVTPARCNLCGGLASTGSGLAPSDLRSQGQTKSDMARIGATEAEAPSRCRISKSTAKPERQTSGLSQGSVGREWEGALGHRRVPWEVMSKLCNAGSVGVDLTGFGPFLWPSLAFAG